MTSIEHNLLSTQVTALEIKEEIVIIGEGQHIHIHNVYSGRRLSSHQVFRATAIHGVRVQFLPKVTTPQDDVWILALYGQKSLSILSFSPTTNICLTVVAERSFSDWIIDVAWERDVSHIILALAHNSLLRCEFKIEDLVKKAYKDNSERTSYPSPECNSSQENSLINSSKTETGVLQDLSINKNVVENGDKIVVEKAKSGEKSLVETAMSGDKSVVETAMSDDKSVVEKAESAEKSVLFSGCIVMVTGSWAGAVFMAGTVTREVLVWGPGGSKDDGGRIIPFHRLTGHQGSIFSVSFCAEQKIIATTSDDRSVQVWEVLETKGESNIDSTQMTNQTQAQDYWKYIKIVKRFRSYGHNARVWRCLILPSSIISVGEDSKVCVWDQEGNLVSSWKAHDGASIWSVAATERADRLITGAGDGSVRSWCLDKKDPPLVELPGLSLDRRHMLFSDNTHKSNASSKCSSSVIRENLEKPCSENMEDPCIEILEDPCTEFVFVDNFKPSLFNETSKKASTKPKKEAYKPDFPRCIALIGPQQPLLVMDSGGLFLWHCHSSSWQLKYQDERLENYALLEVGPNLKTAALATLYGDLILLQLENSSLKVLVDVKVSNGKIFSMLWLSDDELLVCGGGGVMEVWQVWEKEGKLSKVSSHELPVSKQRWVSAACLYLGDSNSDDTTRRLVCGDRAGSLHLYTPQLGEVVNSLRSIHGRNGVTSVVSEGERLYSSGRDGCVRHLAVQDGQLQVLTVTRVTVASWVAQLVLTHGRTLAVCFHDVKLKVWSLEEERSLVEVECGGGHRSWDLQILPNQQELVCVFLKAARVFTFKAKLTDSLLPVIKAPLNTQETMCLQPLFFRGQTIICATGGEDTTLRLHSVGEHESRRSLGVFRSHLSCVRALCIIKRRNICFKAGVNYEKSDKDDNTKWMVSAGGRAQVKVWNCTVVDHSDSSSASRFEELNLEVGDALSMEAGKLDQKAGDKPLIKLGDKLDMIDSDRSNIDGERMGMKLLGDNCAAPTNNSPNVRCREVTSHMLRTGSHKSWKSQEPTLDPETRYMDAASFWVTDTKALVALASSDGVLRIFQFCTDSESLDLVCSEELNCCILKVVVLDCEDWAYLVTATTGGSITFWDTQDVVDWIERCDADNTPLPRLIQKLKIEAAHQSGINSLAFSRLLRSSVPIPTYITFMATGGDDNLLTVWQVMVTVRDHDGALGVHATCISEVHGHASQLTGLHWLSVTCFISVSIDQRMVVWRIREIGTSSTETQRRDIHTVERDSQHNTLGYYVTFEKIQPPHLAKEIEDEGRREKGNCRTPHPLTTLASCFTGVPDVKGLAVLEIDGSSRMASEGILRNIYEAKVLVYGMGLQVFNLRHEPLDHEDYPINLIVSDSPE